MQFSLKRCYKMADRIKETGFNCFCLLKRLIGFASRSVYIIRLCLDFLSAKAEKWVPYLFLYQSIHTMLIVRIHLY